MHLVAKFFFEPVNDGLNCGAANSIWGLKFKQDRRASSDHFPHLYGVIHQGGLARMQDAPGGEKRGHDDAEGEIVVPFRLVGQQDEACHQPKPERDDNEGILVDY